MKIKISLFLLLASTVLKAQELQKPIFGKIDHIEKFQSKFAEARNIDIWLPENYDGKKKFAVLYMHDGQMLFDSSATWNHKTWNVDDVSTKLLKENKVKNFIVVGIWNSGTKRHADYFPQKPFENLTRTEKDSVVNQLKKSLQTTDVFKPNSDNYLRFLVTELKPMIDKKYSVLTGPKNTFVSGSSMGGLISLYAMCEYPNVFGGIACLSTHWTGSFANENNPIPNSFLKYINEKLPSTKNHKIYFDSGDQGIDAHYPPIQEKIDSILKNKGFTTKNWTTKYFKGKDHCEKSWNERFDIPLLFLLGK
jgi:predicted alpha/beta superfamily hydrolase